jgi:hypothetical protein
MLPGRNRASMIRSIAINLFINIVCPYAIFRILVPHYPAGSVVPLLWSGLLPAGEFLLTLSRRRVLDAVSTIVLFQILFSLLTTLFAADVHWALVWGASQDGILGLVFLLSALAGYPVIRYYARQFVAANDPVRAAAFDVSVTQDGKRAFKIVTLVWAFALIGLCAVKLILTAALPPAAYLLFGPSLGSAVIVVLVWWTVRFVRPRLRASPPESE